MNDLGWEYSLPDQWQALEVRRLLQHGSAGIKIGPFGSELRLSDLSDSGERVYGQENVIARDFTIGKRFVSGPKLSALSAYRVSPGDILVTMMGTSGRCAAVPVGAEHGIMDSHLLRLRFQDDEINSRFAVWVLGESSIVREQFVVLGRGSIMHGLNSGIVKSVRLPVPSLAEQRAIAAFLDRKTKAIDDLIQKKARLIELLQEKRQALITQVVTKGLDPTIPMKDSGLEWLGEIPEHWKVVRLKFLVVESVAGPYGSSLTKAMYSASGYRVYGQQQVIPDDFTIGDYYISEAKFWQMRRYQVFPGDVLVSVMGTVGRVAVVPDDIEPGIINPRLVRYKANMERIRPRFLQLAMRGHGCASQLNLAAQGVTMDGINMRILGELPIAIPSLDEQDEILESVRGTTQRTDASIQAVRTQINLLREYRQALISAAVTGKIDVT